MVEFQRRPPSEWEPIKCQGLCPNNVDHPFYDCSRMGEVLHLEKTYWAVHVVDQVQVQPEVQGKESESTSRAADQEFDCWWSRRSLIRLVQDSSDWIVQASWALSSKSPLLPLRPVLTEGIVRVGGHLDKALIPFEARHQVVLSPKDPLSRLLVQDLQNKHCQVGREHTLALVRRQVLDPTREIIH